MAAEQKKKLSYQDMRTILAQGGSVMYEGEIITDPAALPSETDLALGDDAREQERLAAIRQQREALEREEQQVVQAKRERQQQEEAAKAKAAQAEEERQRQEVHKLERAQEAAPAKAEGKHASEAMREAQDQGRHGKK